MSTRPIEKIIMGYPDVAFVNKRFSEILMSMAREVFKGDDKMGFAEGG
jgi:hypothetical protein